jgi:hypothetical protein
LEAEAALALFTATTKPLDRTTLFGVHREIKHQNLDFIVVSIQAIGVHNS